MSQIVFFLEEASAEAMLNGLLPRLLPAEIGFRCIPFEGKQDLEKQLMRKIRAYQNEQARFIVLRDQDSHPDCQAVKGRLLELCEASGKSARCLVRIACRELEAFYLADLLAVEQALSIPGLAKRQQSRKFKNPDSLGSPRRRRRRSRTPSSAWKKKPASASRAPRRDLAASLVAEHSIPQAR